MRNHDARSSNRPVWMFMVATAMATTVSTLAATAMVQDQSAQAVAVTCECEAEPAPACEGPSDPVVAPAETAPAEAAPAEAVPDQQAAPAQSASMEVEGQLDKHVLRRVVRAHIGEVRYCYNQGLQEDPQLAGRVEVQFTIGAEGSVAESTVASTDIDQSGVPQCIAEAVARWQFPRPSDGEKTVVTYPFVLEPG